MCLSLLQINSGQKVDFLKRTPIHHFHSCFLPFTQCQHHFKAKLGMYFAQPSFSIIERCDQNSTPIQKGSHCAVWCLSGGGRLTFIYHRSFMLCCKLQLVPVLGRALDRAQSLKLGSICLAQFTLPQNAPQPFLIKNKSVF